MRSLFYKYNDLKKSIKYKKQLQYTTTSFEPNTGNYEFFIDGKETMKQIAESIYDSKYSIKIMGWKIDYFIPLIRTHHELEGKTLLDLLLYKAQQGIKIKIIIYKSPEFTEMTNNRKTKKILNNLHPNIICYCVRRTFIYSHHEKLILLDDNIAFIGGIDLCTGRYDRNDHPISLCQCSDCCSNCLECNEMMKEFPQCDYINSQLKKSKYTILPRMPWHDIHCKLTGNIVRDLMIHFYQRWQFYGGSIDPITCIFEKGNVQMKVCRSVCYRSGGIEESSIYGEMLKLIKESKYFIYIEQQYFLSFYEKKNISNKLGNQIAERIIEADKKNEPFFVIMVLPVFSEGNLKDKSIRKIIEYTRKTLFDGIYSIINILKRNGINDVMKYLCICNLYNYGFCKNYGYTTSQIYIHSKLMIVDDRKVLIGSANMNDRSLRGDRDTEICVSIEENENFEYSFGNNYIYKGNSKIKELRNSLWIEHLGLTENELNLLNDPFVCFHQVWKSIAISNRSIFEEVFPLFPRNSYKKFIDIKQHTHPIAIPHKVPLLNKIKGHLVLFAIEFGLYEHQRSYGLQAIVT